MSTQRTEDLSEATITPSVAAVEPSGEADALSPDDTNSVDHQNAAAGKSESSAELAQDADAAESKVVEEVEEGSTPAPTTDFQTKLSETASS